MSSDKTNPPKRNPAFDRSYGQIWQEHLARMLNAGYSEEQARISHRRWKSAGRKLKAGRY